MAIVQGREPLDDETEELSAFAVATHESHGSDVVVQSRAEN